MDLFLYYSDPFLYECPHCDALFMPEDMREIIQHLLEEKGFKKNTPEFDIELEKFIENAKQDRHYVRDLPESDPNWKDPLPEQEAFGNA